MIGTATVVTLSAPLILPAVTVAPEVMMAANGAMWTLGIVAAGYSGYMSYDAYQKGDYDEMAFNGLNAATGIASAIKGSLGFGNAYKVYQEGRAAESVAVGSAGLADMSAARDERLLMLKIVRADLNSADEEIGRAHV